MRFFSKRGQSLLEYAILFAVILSALLIMQFYIKRGYQGRLKQSADSVGQQYAPGHTTSKIVTTSSSTTRTTTADGKMVVKVDPAKSSLDKTETVDAFAKE
ncbi:MAG: hypothetical protein KKE64_05590 [Candidatus Omnitrophica bacterium]|nr:hypothetical protein [Candidatus Omnitrophota bacterium]